VDVSVLRLSKVNQNSAPVGDYVPG